MPEMHPLDRLPRFMDDPDPFINDEIGRAFYTATRFAVDNYGDDSIPQETLLELQQLHHLTDMELPAYQYLAQLRVRAEKERVN